MREKKDGSVEKKKRGKKKAIKRIRPAEKNAPVETAADIPLIIFFAIIGVVMIILILIIFYMTILPV